MGVRMILMKSSWESWSGAKPMTLKSSGKRHRFSYDRIRYGIPQSLGYFDHALNHRVLETTATYS